MNKWLILVVILISCSMVWAEGDDQTDTDEQKGSRRAFGIGLSGGYSPWFFLSQMDFKVADLDLSKTDTGAYQLKRQMSFHVTLEPGLNYASGLIYLPIGYYHIQGELRTKSSLRSSFLELLGIGPTWESYRDFQIQLFRIGFGGGFWLPKSGPVSFVMRLHGDLFVGTLAIDDLDTSSGFGGGLGSDVGIRYYFGQPAENGRPTGFSLGVGAESEVGGMVFFQSDSKSQRTDTFSGWPIGLFINLSYGY